MTHGILFAIVKRCLISALARLTTASALAWDVEGHQIVARLAATQLNPVATSQVAHLLAQEPGATLASISTWADENRSAANAAWHYVNFPKGDCHYLPARDCPDGNCVIEAINQQMEILRGSSPDDQKLQALKYLVHFVADVHQPLHAGYAEDRGGNRYQLEAFMRGSNLHALWDSGLIRNLNELPATTAARLLAQKLPLDVNSFTATSIAEESCRMVETPGFYPDRKVGADYVERFTPVMEQRLKLAGARLARLLNGVWP